MTRTRSPGRALTEIKLSVRAEIASVPSSTARWILEDAVQYAPIDPPACLLIAGEYGKLDSTVQLAAIAAALAIGGDIINLGWINGRPTLDLYGLEQTLVCAEVYEEPQASYVF